MKTKNRLHKLMAYVLTLVMLMTFAPGFTLTSGAASLAPASVVLEVTKSINDWDAEDSFTFNLEAITAGAPMPANTVAVASEHTPSAFFEAITYEAEGIYEYTITEEQGSTPGMSYDTAPHTVLVTVTADAGNNLSATVTYDGEDELIITNTYTPPTVSANVSAVDITNGSTREGAEFQLINLVGYVVDTKITAPDDPDTTDVDESVSTFNGLTAGEVYTLRTVTAPYGYILPNDVTFSVDELGNVSSTGTFDVHGTILVEFTMTRVAISAVDANDGSEIEGALLQIRDQHDQVVEEWVSADGPAHEITGLPVGVDYTLHTACPPDGYVMPADTDFTIDENSDIRTSGIVDTFGTMLAVFERTCHIITYHTNDGTDHTTTETVFDGFDFIPNINAVSYLNCDLAYWNTEADGSGTFYMAGEEIEDVSEDIDLYAFWELPLYETDSFENDVCSWSGNDSEPHTFALKDGAELYASIILPAENSDEESIITVDGDCAIKGTVSFDGIERATLTVKGNGSLECDGIVPTSSGNKLKVETDTTVKSDLNLGASGGMDSNIAINGATLTVDNGGVVLLNYFTMKNGAKLIVQNGRMSFHGYTEFDLSDDSEIHIEGDGFGCVLYKESGDNTAFDELISEKWLPSGYYFVEENFGYYLYDAEDNLVTDGIILKKVRSTPRPSGGGGSSWVTVRFETNGGSGINSQNILRNRKVTEPEVPVRNGFTFEGWYTDIGLKDSYDFETKVTKGFTLYAKWAEAAEETPEHDCASAKYSDLDVNEWYHPHTDYVLEEGIFRGADGANFEPDTDITRGMMVTVLYRAEGEPEVSGKATFEDTDENAYYARAVIWGQQNGIIKGYSETVYAPEQTILREQIAAILYRYANYKGFNVAVSENTDISTYADYESISEYAVPAMKWAVESGMLKGRTAHTLNPSDFATRVEIAAMFHRFVLKYEK